ncbi:hypothetical protein KEM56_002423 [Ascosphaera pollenicola]|nr:hypothetical protein KEM56_002423 [Ascosphaera pollenicola]
MSLSTDSPPIDAVLESIRQLDRKRPDGTATAAQDEDDASPPLNILRLSGPVSRQSDRVDGQSPSRENALGSVAGEAADDLTPAMLEDDLAHYKELFAKLRFSYVEQVTKERYLRGIVGDPPLVVGHEENLELEAKLGEKKAELKRHKEDIDHQVNHVAKFTNDLTKRHEALQRKIVLLSEVPSEVASLKATLEALTEVEGLTEELPVDENALGDYTNMPLANLRETLNERTNDIISTESQLASAKNRLELEVSETDQIETELERLQRRRERVLKALHDEGESQVQSDIDRLETEKRYRRTLSILQVLDTA